MSHSQIYEGTAEEIAQQLSVSKLNGRLKAVVTPEEPARRPPPRHHREPVVEPRKLQGYGMFARVPGGSEAYAAEKQLEIDREDRKFR